MSLLLIGTYTRGSGGIHLVEMDDHTGALEYRHLAAECVNPSFLVVSPDRKSVFTVHETADYKGANTGSVGAFCCDPITGKLTLRNTQSSHGSYPCHITISKSGKHVLVANYGSGTLAVLPVLHEGSLADASCIIQHHGSSVNSSRQEGPHAHSVNLDASNRFALACDLGTDQILIYRFDGTHGALTPSKPAAVAARPGAGPRHLAFHPNGRIAYVINELDSTIAAYRYASADGSLALIDTVSTLPTGFSGASTTAEVVVHPAGKWVYGSNRGHDSIAVFAVNPGSGALRPVGHVSTEGKTPRNFVCHPSGSFLVVGNQESDTLIVFQIDLRTGIPRPTQHRVSVPQPVCVRFL